MIALAAQWLVLAVYGVVMLFVAEIGVAILLALLGRAREKFENATAFALALCVVVGYILGTIGIPSGFRLQWRQPLSVEWFVVVGVLVAIIALAEEITGFERRPLRYFSDKLSGWQRIWVAIAVILLAPTLLGVAIAWPKESGLVLRDLEDPLCHQPLVIERAEYGQPCYNLASFSRYTAPVTDQREYQAVIDRQRVAVIGAAAGIWGGIVIALYAAGLGIGWIRDGFRRAA